MDIERHLRTNHEAATSLDVALIASEGDLSRWGEHALYSCDRYLCRARNCFIVSPDRAKVEDMFRRYGPNVSWGIIEDADLLHQRERSLPGWLRQQIIKLRLYELTDSDYVCAMGIDTILLRRLRTEDLISKIDQREILRYNVYSWPSKHYRFERCRLAYIADALGILPKRSYWYGDFICDIFTFNSEKLAQLESLIEDTLGPWGYFKLFSSWNGGIQGSRYRRGEWSLYCMFLLDVLNEDITLQPNCSDFVAQLHDIHVLSLLNEIPTAVHVVSGDIGPQELRQAFHD